MAHVRADGQPAVGRPGVDGRGGPRRGRLAQVPRSVRLHAEELLGVPVRAPADDREREGYPAAARIRSRPDPRRGVLDAAANREGRDGLRLRSHARNRRRNLHVAVVLPAERLRLQRLSGAASRREPLHRSRRDAGGGARRARFRRFAARRRCAHPDRRTRGAAEARRGTAAMKDEEPLATLFQAHPWHGVAAGDPADFVNAYIEIVPSDVVKYELDKASGHLRIDRPQRYSSLTPSLYGFIPQTYCGDRVAARCAERTGNTGIRGDRDPMDICVLTEKGNAHGGFLLRARPVGGLRMIDGDEADDKVLAVLENDLVFGAMEDIGQVPAGRVGTRRPYFLIYKQKPRAGAPH